jgi:hypothetical protein
MQKYSHLFLFCAYLFSSILFSGCGDKCCCCPEDVELSDTMEMRIPYQVGQVVRFANAAGDTTSLSCTEREYSQEERYANERPQSECCPAYLVENVACKLSAVSGDFLNIRTDYNAGYNTLISARLDGVGYSDEHFSNKIDSVILNSKVFYDILTTEEDDEEIFMLIGINQGIVGFTINGEEWALVE